MNKSPVSYTLMDRERESKTTYVIVPLFIRTREIPSAFSRNFGSGSVSLGLISKVATSDAARISAPLYAW